MPSEEKSNTSGKSNLIIAVILSVLIAGGGGFFAGVKYQQSKTSAFMRNRPENLGDVRGRFEQRGTNPGLRPVSGEVLSRDENSITVKLADDSSKIILLTDTSTINKTEEGSIDDLSEGTKVVVFGEENSDGSITANNIQIGTNLFRGELQ